MTTKIIIDYAPIALKRPRFSTRSGKVYDSQKKEKDIERFIIRSQWKGEALICPVKLHISYFIQIPLSWSNKKKGRVCDQPCVSRPDIDNYIKWNLDVLNGLVFIDDSQVYELRACKLYGEPRTEIEISSQKMSENSL